MSALLLVPFFLNISSCTGLWLYRDEINTFETLKPCALNIYLHIYKSEIDTTLIKRMFFVIRYYES